MYKTKILNKVLVVAIVAMLASLKEISGVESPQPKIIGGSQASPNELPYQVAVFLQGGFGCSGAIIDEFHVITSAFCADGILDYYLPEVTIKAGEHSLSKDDKTEQISQPAKVIKHPGYNPNRMTNDIAVIELVQGFTFTNAVQPLPLAPSGHWSSGEVLLSGWGAYSEWGPISDILRKVTSEIITDSTCRESYQVTEIVDSMLCTKSADTEADTCDRDSGSPVVCRDISSVPYICGIVSWGRGCGVGFPAVHTEVAYYTNWILQFATNATHAN